MKKKFFLLIFITFSPIFAFADESLFSIGGDSGYLIDGLMKGGWGAGGIIEIRLLDKLSFVVDAGYIEYKDTKNSTTNLVTTTSVFGTLRWYTVSGIIGFFAGGGLGTFYTTVSSEKIQGYLFPLEAGIKFTFFGSKGIFIEPDLIVLLKYGNAKFLFGMKYGVNVGVTF